MANDIGNAVLAGDKVGSWWMLHATGAMEAGSSLTMSPTGSPGTNPLSYNGSTQWHGSANVAFPTGDFSFVTVINLSSFPGVGVFYDLLAKWGAATIGTFLLELNHAGALNLYVAGTGAAVNGPATSAAVSSGSYIVVGGTYTSATAVIKLRVAGTTYTVTGAGTGTNGVSMGHFLGARESTPTSPSAFTSYGAIFTEKVLSDADIDRIGAMVAPLTNTDWLKLNGIETSGIASALDNVKGTRREIGERAPATDGTMRVSVQALKRDLSFRTTALTGADAFAWESFIRGEGHVWQFEDFGLYSCKGSIPADTTGCTLVTGSAKFGTKKLRISAGQFQTDTAALTNMYGGTGDYTVMFWKSTDSGATWHHYVARSDGAQWVDGAVSVSSFAAFLLIGGNTVQLQSNADFDDFVCFPFKVLDTWPALFFARTTSYPNTPFLEATGALVPEQATRLVAGDASETVFKTVASKTNRRLDVTLTAR